MLELRLAVTALVVASAVSAAQTDSTAKLPGAFVERDTVSLVAAAKLAKLPAAKRAEWEAYVAQSRQLGRRDRELLAGELLHIGQATRTRAPYIRESFVVDATMTDAFFASDKAVAMAGTMLSFQTPSGGWSKHVDMTASPRRPGQSFFSENDDWHYIATLDNNSTTAELEFLGRLERARHDSAYRAAFLRGFQYLVDAQMPNGCWPQVFPLQGGYHDAATFNDDAIVNAIRLLTDISRGVYAFVPAARREVAAQMVDHAERCIRAAQVVVRGKKTIWGQQHDPVTLTPVDARSYEHASLAGRESVAIVEFLMSRSHPDADLVAAIHAAADWYKANVIHGQRYDRYGLTTDASAPPLWARMAEIGTNRLIVSNRDGKIRYDWNELTDRREGYNWFTDWPSAMLVHYEKWARQHPRGT